MVTTKRSHHNPILLPNRDHNWEAEAAFNGSILKEESAYSMVYRAVGLSQLYRGIRMSQSTIGLAQSGDGIHFKRRQQLITPEKEWEVFGVEDPRLTKLDDTYYIFYTAISNWPPSKEGIKIAVAVTKDLNKIEEKHPVTFFNAKAMAMFPGRVNGKIAVVLTVHTDDPPSKICLALLDDPQQLWDEKWWRNWYSKLDEHVIPIYHTPKDHLEVGGVPVLTDEGWVLVFCYIQDYFTDQAKIFRIDAVLLEKDNPQKIIGQTMDPLLVPEEQYEIYGMVPNVIFPSGAMVEEDQFYVYYGSTDTTVCRASINVNDLLEDLKSSPLTHPDRVKKPQIFTRFEGNPILSPIKDHSWESKYTFNAGAILAGDRIHILYRAMGDDDTSVLGYASSKDGLHVDERLDTPVYVPREPFEMKYHPGFSGCEDPRLTAIGDTIYMCYTAYDGNNPPRVGLSTIKYDDLVNKKWNWSKPILISAPGVDNKDSCIVSEKIGGKYMLFHRIQPCIWVDMVSDLDFGDNRWLGGHPLFGPRVGAWDNLKIGLNGPPEKTEDGWLLLYHGVSKSDLQYRMGAALLDLENPFKVIARLHNPIFEPITWYENEGYRAGTVFSCGQVIKDGTLYVYYGGADTFVAVASTPVKTLLDLLKKGK